MLALRVRELQESKSDHALRPELSQLAGQNRRATVTVGRRLNLAEAMAMLAVAGCIALAIHPEASRLSNPLSSPSGVMMKKGTPQAAADSPWSDSRSGPLRHLYRRAAPSDRSSHRVDRHSRTLAEFNRASRAQHPAIRRDGHYSATVALHPAGRELLVIGRLISRTEVRVSRTSAEITPRQRATMGDCSCLTLGVDDRPCLTPRKLDCY
jgi:hypothetical protein